MSIAKGRTKAKIHFKCLLCNLIIANRGGHLERWHEAEVNRLTVRGMIGTDEQELFFNEYFIKTIEPTSSQMNLIDYNSGMNHRYAFRIRSKTICH